MPLHFVFDWDDHLYLIPKLPLVLLLPHSNMWYAQMKLFRNWTVILCAILCDTVELDYSSKTSIMRLRLFHNTIGSSFTWSSWSIVLLEMNNLTETQRIWFRLALPSRQHKRYERGCKGMGDSFGTRYDPIKLTRTHWVTDLPDQWQRYKWSIILLTNWFSFSMDNLTE